MRINFFEEYATDENFAKLALISWPATVFVAERSLAEFGARVEEYARQYPHITFGWWPLLPKSYWLSGLANPQETQMLFDALVAWPHEGTAPVLLDLELPQKLTLYLSNWAHLGANKRLLARFLADAPQHGIQVYTAEYPAPNTLMSWLIGALGISPSFNLSHTKLPMCYSSMMRQYFGEGVWRWMKRFETRFIQAHPERVGLALGVTAAGVLGNEPLLTAQGLAEDLEWAQTSGAREVCIFRLGGLNEEYLSVIERFATQ